MEGSGWVDSYREGSVWRVVGRLLQGRISMEGGGWVDSYRERSVWRGWVDSYVYREGSVWRVVGRLLPWVQTGSWHQTPSAHPLLQSMSFCAVESNNTYTQVHSYLRNGLDRLRMTHSYKRQ